MSINATKPEVYTDFKGLTELRLNAQSNPEQTLRAAGRQFEALFIQMMLQSMRDASPGDPLLGDGGGQAMYRDMFDKQISLALSEKGSLGLAEAVMRQLRQGLPATPSEPMPLVQPLIPATSDGRPDASSQVTPPVAPANPDASRNNSPQAFNTPDEFVTAMWPAAQAAARDLGLDPRVLIAQAALETGWGRSVMQHGDGRSSHNLFGIKAAGNWEGLSVRVPTVEYRDGVAVKERADFRAYDSFKQSFADYVDFLKSQPRYREALAHGGDARRFLGELQSAGYATDPRYADKIGAILQGEVLSGRTGDSIGSGGKPIV